MNQKEYQLIADIFKRELECYPVGSQKYNHEALRAHTEILILVFSARLAKNYPKTFNQVKFLKACGLETSPPPMKSGHAPDCTWPKK